jgi:hypothetical protein
MLKLTRRTVWNLVLLVLFPVGVGAQNFVYTNNDLAAGNSISAFSVDMSGTLSELTSLGSPYSTGGMGAGGGSYSPNRIIVVKGSSNTFLYASNAHGSGAVATVSGFIINTTTNPGALEPMLMSPFDTDGYDGSPTGVSLAATPDGKYVYAGSTGLDITLSSLGIITIFSIENADALHLGELSRIGSIAPDGPMYSMKVSPDGKFLVLSVDFRNSSTPPPDPTKPYGLEVINIGADETLQTAPKSRLVFSPNPVTSVDISCDGDQLYAGTASLPMIYVFNISTDGSGVPALTELIGPPFPSSSAGSYQGVALSTDDSTLFASNQLTNELTAFPVFSGDSTYPDGTLDVGHAISVPVGDSEHTIALGPGGLSVSKDGAFLYAADASVGGLAAISPFSLSASSLSLRGVTFTGQPLGLNSLAAYPAKACSETNTGEPKLTVNKVLNPSADPRRFNLQINGTTWATNVGDGGTTGAQDGVIGSNTVTETVGMPGTGLSDFSSVIGGDCAADGTITLAAGDNKTCTITNTRNLPSLTGIDPASAILGGPAFSMSLAGTNFGADSTGRFDGSDRTTHYTSPDTTHLTVDIPASDLLTPGQFPITVYNSLATAGASNPITFTVSYRFLGLFEPYAPPLRQYHVNSSIPLRWQYATANGTVVPSSMADPLIEIFPAAGCGNVSTGGSLAVEAAGNSGYKYHTPSNTWQFNWKTEGSIGPGCYVIYIKSQLTGQTDGPFPIQLVN